MAKGEIRHLLRRVCGIGITWSLCLGLSAAPVFAGGGVLGETTVGNLFPSSYGTDKLPDGFLIKQTGSSDIYIIRSGKKSLIFRPIFDRWVKEAHYFKGDVVITLPASEMKKYPSAPPRNLLYMGRILSANGRRYFIDDKLRRRSISPKVQAALKYPARNVYTVPQGLLDAFPDGPAITRTDRHPGGTVMYRGAYHGGIVYLITGDDTKREFLQDYAYETRGYPWSSQIIPVSPEELARYKRGPHISTYPDGWVVGKGSRIYLTQGDKLRWIASNAIFQAMKYNSKYVLRVFPEFLKNYAEGDPVTAFKGILTAVSESSANTAKDTAAAGRSSTASLRVPPETRRLISQVNVLFLPVYDRNPTAAENAFWVDYLYKGEAQTEEAFVSALKDAKVTGARPAITSRDVELPPEKLKKYVSFLFYYVFGRIPDEGEKTFWDQRVDSGLRKTITDLGGNMQYLKERGMTKR